MTHTLQTKQRMIFFKKNPNGILIEIYTKLLLKKDKRYVLASTNKNDVDNVLEDIKIGFDTGEIK